jgi:penicillin G amidase
LGIISFLGLVFLTDFVGEFRNSSFENGEFYTSETWEKVSIGQSVNGVIHIKSYNVFDMFFGQGFANAQYQLWQLEYKRRMVMGTLSELYGEETFETDKFFRTLGIYESSKYSLDKMDNYTIGALEEFCSGINEFMSRNPDLPIEFKVFGFKPALFYPVDIISFFKLYSFGLSMNLDLEIERYRLLQKGIPINRVLELFPPVFEDFTETIVNVEDLKGFNKTIEEINKIEKDFLNNTGV